MIVFTNSRGLLRIRFFYIQCIILYVMYFFLGGGGGGGGVAMSLHYDSYYYDSLTLSFILRMHVEDMVLLSVTPV